jgi:hypothetical protein
VAQGEGKRAALKRLARSANPALGAPLLTPTTAPAPHTAWRARASTDQVRGRLSGRCYWPASREIFPLQCPQCGGQMRLIAFVTEAP